MSDRFPNARTGYEVTCEEVLTFLASYLEGELPPLKVEEFERHLALCPSCVAYIDTYRQTVALSRGASAAGSPGSPAEELPEDLVRAVLAARRRE